MVIFKSVRAIFLLFILFPLLGYAASWQIVPDKSTLTFTATQNNSPVTGQFKNFSGDIHFDPNQLATSQVDIVVDLGSVSTAYKEVADTLLTDDFFDVKDFPKAEFKATQFTKLNDKTYQANGTLTIRNKTLPLILTFTLTQYTDTNAIATGTALLKRTAFGVGRGEWSNTSNIKDDVKINFTLTATKKS